MAAVQFRDELNCHHFSQIADAKNLCQDSNSLLGEPLSVAAKSLHCSFLFRIFNERFRDRELAGQVHPRQ
jgi:hypothetical protein